MNLVFASNNQHKAEEIRHIFLAKGLNINILSLSDIGINQDIEENGKTLEENALIKSNFVYKQMHINCFADDTGLEIEALNGSPGVNTARFAGEDKSNEANINKVLLLLKNETNRNAKFRTIISLNYENKLYSFEGSINGVIAKQKMGEKGFGYDPIFIPEGYDISFAQMTDNLKNSLSHRYIAINKLIEFLNIKIIK